MASPQVENGALSIALELQLAIMRREFSALERRVLDAIMRYTYAAGKAKAEISAEDIRLMIEGAKRVRTDRIEAVLVKLTEQNVLTCQPWNNKQLLGVQKDYERWVDKMSVPINRLDINNISISRSGVDKMSTSSLETEQKPTTLAASLVAYSEEKCGFKHGTTTWRVEHSWAGKLLRKVVALTNDSAIALQLIKDYIEENEWMRQNVQRQFAYMYPKFDQWYRQIPRKPRDIRESEEAMGRRYRYNVKLKQWEVT